MNKPTDFGEIVIIETDDFDKFPRKKLMKTYNKFNDIRNAFKNNKFYLGSGFDINKVLKNQESNSSMKRLIMKLINTNREIS